MTPEETRSSPDGGGSDPGISPNSLVAAQKAKAERFLDLHEQPWPLLLPNPWDQGTTRLLASLGFDALATTSGGFAATLGRLDGSVSREEALHHAALVAGATDLPVSADLEDGFSADPAGVATTISGALEAGVAGCSIEDFTRDPSEPIYDFAHAVERVSAAAETAHRGPVHLVLTARAENHLHGRDDLADTIRRLVAYGEAGADVVYAPGLIHLNDIRQVVSSVGRPVNVLLRAGGPPVAALAEAGVRRVSIGGSFAYLALDAVAAAAREFRQDGTQAFLAQAAAGASVARSAFGA